MMIMRNLCARIVTWFIIWGQLWTYTWWANMALGIHVPIVVLFFTCLCSAINIKDIVFSYMCLVHFFALFCKLHLTFPHELMWCFLPGLCLWQHGCCELGVDTSDFYICLLLTALMLLIFVITRYSFLYLLFYSSIPSSLIFLIDLYWLY